MPDTDKLPTSWRPREGETLTGFVAQRVERPSQYGDESVVVVVIDPLSGPQVSVWCSATALRGFIKDIDPQEGDFVSLYYEGETITRKGYGIKRYLYSKMVPGERE